MLECENPSDNKYLVQWDGTAATTVLPRVRLYFLAEDPFRFAKRVAEAYGLRRRTESSLRYNLFVDSMPTEEIPPLTVEQINRVLGFALNSKRLREKLMDTSQLINEVNVDYARTMNKIVFDEAIKRKSFPPEMLVQVDEDFPEEPGRPVPERGTVAVPAYDFPEQFSEFSFHTCLTKGEVIAASVKVRAECLKLLKMSLFVMNVSKTSRLEEFVTTQTQAADQMFNYLRETWVLTLKNIIKSSFKDVGKGWFNLHESNLESYNGSKMKRFLTMVKFAMEDSLRYLVEEQALKFSKFVQQHCGAEINVIDTCRVDNGPAPGEAAADGKRAAGAGAKRTPLLMLELKEDHTTGQFFYTTPLEKLVPALLGLFDHGIAVTHGIPVLEPQIMEKLYWTHRPSLAAVHSQEEKIVQCREAVRVAGDRAVQAATAYLGTYGRHEPLLALDVKKYIEAFEEGLPTLEQMQQEIYTHQDELESLKATLPATICVGPFMVQAEKTRDFLIKKKELLVAMSLEVLARTPKRMSLRLFDASGSAFATYPAAFCGSTSRPGNFRASVPLK